MMTRQIIKVDDLACLKTVSSKLDEHTKIPVFINLGKEYVNAENYKACWNVQKLDIANIVSKNFQIIQHREIFNILSDSLSNLNLKVSGRMDNFGDVVRCDLIFDGQKEIDDKQKGIKLGIRVTNSNNKSTSFKMEMYAYRIVCQNGMTIGNIIPGVGEKQIHFGLNPIDPMKIQISIQKFVKDVINNSVTLQKVVNEAMKDSIEWDILKKIMPQLITTKKYMIDVYKKIGVEVMEVYDKKTDKVIHKFLFDNNKKLNRWEIYNAVTSIISHDTQLKTTTENTLENCSRILLKNKFEALQKIYV